MPWSITSPMTAQLEPLRTIPQHIETLRSRSMSVDDDLATQWLTHVSYYRLSSYWHPARHIDGSGHRDDTFIDGTFFTDAVHLYEADRKLRTLVFDGMERIEVAMRTHLIDQLYATSVLTQPGLSRSRHCSTPHSFRTLSWNLTALASPPMETPPCSRSVRRY